MKNSFRRYLVARRHEGVKRVLPQALLFVLMPGRSIRLQPGLLRSGALDGRIGTNGIKNTGNDQQQCAGQGREFLSVVIHKPTPRIAGANSTEETHRTSKVMRKKNPLRPSDTSTAKAKTVAKQFSYPFTRPAHGQSRGLRVSCGSRDCFYSPLKKKQFIFLLQDGSWNVRLET